MKPNNGADELVRVVIASTVGFAGGLWTFYNAPAINRGPIWLLLVLQAAMTLFVWLILYLVHFPKR